MFAIELCLVAVSCLLAQICPGLGSGWFSKLEKGLSTFARRRGLVVWSVGATALLVRLLLLPILPVPQPIVHDEFSNLLLADTLAHGRLANPTHPMWVHFETFHVNWHPTYASMYYPGHALFLAFGLVVLGHPFWGVWLSGGLMCAAICWCLQGWLPQGWALVGGLMALIRLATFSYWVDSYWGGTVATLGGALALGALPRIKQNQRARDAVLMALGMTLLAWTRPYEGLFFCAPIIIALIWWATRKDAPPIRLSLARIALPVASIMAIALVMLGYYFYKVTGSPTTIPYKLNMQSYGLVFFPWDKIRPVIFHHETMQAFYRGDPVVGVYQFALDHPLKLQFYKKLVVWLFYFGPLLTAPWIFWLLTRPRGHFWKSFRPDLRFILTLMIVAYIPIMLTIYIGQPHYAAPMTAAFYVFILLVMRDLYEYAANARPVGRFLARSIPLTCILLMVLRAATPAMHLTPKPSWIRTWCSQDWQNLDRARVLNQLENTPGQHLVIVRYHPGHDSVLDEWVFNNADINGSKVIWARDMGVDENQKLIQYFNGRNAWLVEPDLQPIEPKQYRASQ
jgi:hypothetical protein